MINNIRFNIFLFLIIGYLVSNFAQPVQPRLSNNPSSLSQSSNSKPLGIEPNEKWENIPEEVKNSNAFKRYEWFYRNRENTDGNFPKDFIKEQKVKELAKIKTYVQKGNKIQTTSDSWTNIGPKAIDMSSSFISHWGKVSGRVRGVAVHPTDPNTVYIGAAAGGIWKTIDGGDNWTDMSGDLNLLTFGAIAIDPSNPNTVYAGSGEVIKFFNPTTFEGDGLYKSTDGGISWIKITNGFGSNVHFGDIEVSPHNSNIVLAALGSGNWNSQTPGNEGIWRSADAGITWTRVINIGDGFEVAFDPINTTRAYAGCGGGGFYISTSSGSTFSQSNTGLPTIDRIQFSLAKSLPSTIYASIYPGNGFRIYKSTNSGSSWSALPVLGSGTQGWYDLSVDVNPSDPNSAYFGQAELSKTTDGTNLSMVGASYWETPMHVDIHKIVYAPSDPNVIYIGCDGGIYKSTDGGSTWTHKNNDINTIQFYNIASDPNDEDKIFGGAQDNGNFSTSDKGATDWEFETSGDGMQCFVDYNNSNNIFVSTQNGNLIRSTDGGANWSSAVTLPNGPAWTAPYWQHPTNSSYIYAADRYIARSTSSGASGTWTYVSSSLGNTITSVAHSPANTNKLIAVGSYYDTTPKVSNSSDEGVSWVDITTNITTSFTATSIQKAVADPLDENTFYLCRVSYTTGQVLKTTDFGTTWTDISGNLPKIAHNDLFVDPANTNHFYVANDFGVYWTNNGGTDWHKLSNGMPFVPVLDFDFYVNGSTRLLRAASHGRGIFEMQIDTPLQKIYVDLKVYLEGAYNSSNMFSDINADIPLNQPYNAAPWNYGGTETAVSIGDDIVDWVLIELRTGETPSAATTVVSQKAGLLKTDGTIVDSDGISSLNFDVAAGNYYIVIYHRNHLPIMSPTELTIN